MTSKILTIFGSMILIALSLDIVEAQIFVPLHVNSSDTFGVYSSTLAGAPPVEIASDNTRELNHIHSCGTNYLFTRYNNINDKGVYSLETGDYTNTEAVVCNTITSLCYSIQTPSPSNIFAGATYSNDCSTIYFISNQGIYAPNQSIGSYNVATQAINYNFITASNAFLGDPAIGASGTFYLAGNVGGGANAIYSYKNGVFTQLSNPTAHGAQSDSDPTPLLDESAVIFPRFFSTTEYQIWKVTTDASHTETQLSPGSGSSTLFIEGQIARNVSPDGTTIIISHFDITGGVGSNALYTMLADGTGRTQIPIIGYPTGPDFLTEPTFYPVTSCGSTSPQILYSGRVQSRL